MLKLFKRRPEPRSSPVERPDVFLSYSRLDTKEAVKIAEALKKQNFTVWYDKDIQSGADWRKAIQTKMMRSRCVVLYWSKQAEQSWWVAYEVFTAQSLDKLIVTSFEDINEGSESWARDLQCVRLRKPIFRSFTSTPDWARLVGDIEHKRKRLPRLKHRGWISGGVVHEGGVTSVVFDPSDDARLVSTGRDGKAYVWRTDEIRPTLATTTNAETETEDLAPGTPPPADRCFTLGAPANDKKAWAIQRAAFSGDGARLVLACEDGTARVFNGASLSAAHIVLNHTKVFVADYGGERLFGRNRYVLGVIDGAVSPSGQVLTFGGDGACVWSLDGPEPQSKRLDLPPGSRRRAIDCLWSEAARAFFISDAVGRIHRITPDGTMTSGALPPRAAPGAVLGHRVGTVGAIDGDIIATCSLSPGDRRIDVQQWKEGGYDRFRNERVDASGNHETPAEPITIRADYPVRALAIHPDAPVLVLAAGYRPALVAYDDGNRIDLASEAGDHQQALTTIAISKSGRYVAAGGEDGCISIWEDETPRTTGARGETAAG